MQNGEGENIFHKVDCLGISYKMILNKTEGRSLGRPNINCR